MVAHLHELKITEFDNEKTMKMTMESTEPLHWYIQVYMEPKDVRQAIFMGLKPSVIWKGLMALLFNKFSFFSSPVPEQEAEDIKPQTTEKPKAPPEPSAPLPENNAANNPLARLKE